MSEKVRPRASLSRGNDALHRLKEEQQKQQDRREAASKRGPSRFYVNKADRGGYEEHELIFLDDDLTNNPMGYEHEVPGPGGDWKSKRTVMCIDDTDDCPICRAVDQGVDKDRFLPAKYSFYATVIDTTPYKIKNGQRAGEVVEHSKKLYVVPHGQVQNLLKVAAACKKANGTTRGMTVVVTKNQQTDARCGVLTPLDNGMLYDFIPEDELEDEFWNDEIKRDNKVVKPAGDDIQSYDYENRLETLTAREMRTVFQLAAPPGSDDHEEENTGSSRRSRRRSRVCDDSAAESNNKDEGESGNRRSRRRRASTSEEGKVGGNTESAGAQVSDEGVGEEPSRRRRRRNANNTDSGINPDIDDEIPF